MAFNGDSGNRNVYPIPMKPTFTVYSSTKEDLSFAYYFITVASSIAIMVKKLVVLVATGVHCCRYGKNCRATYPEPEDMVISLGLLVVTTLFVSVILYFIL